MRAWPRGLAGVALAAGLALAGCDAMPGKPRLADRERLPSEIMDFGTLYARNCAGCHGADGTLGPSRPLNDPVYLALVPRERLRQVIATGVPGTAQPALAISAGGTLTDAQIDALVRGLVETWGRPDAVKNVALPAYDAAAERRRRRARQGGLRRGLRELPRPRRPGRAQGRRGDGPVVSLAGQRSVPAHDGDRGAHGSRHARLARRPRQGRP